MSTTFSFDINSIKAIVFDLDGTLYDLRAVRGLMAFRLAMSIFKSPFSPPFWQRWRIIYSFRKHRKVLRSALPGTGLENRQYEEVATTLGYNETLVRKVVKRWLIEGPLDLLRNHQSKDLIQGLHRLHKEGFKLGILSDYPVRAKAVALGIPVEIFDFLHTTTDPEIDVFKPHKRAFQSIADRLKLKTEQILYVGDRLDVDFTGAKQAGMPCILVHWGRKSFESSVPSVSRPEDIVKIFL